MKCASFVFALGFLALGLGSKPVFAATRSASFAVTVTVLSSCQASTPATAFGIYSAAGGNAASPVSVTCTSPTPYNVSLSAELASSTTTTTRKTAGSALDSLRSALLPNSAHTVNWGRMTGMGTVAGTGSGPSQPRAGYGRTAWPQNVAPGAYADSVTVTVTY